MCVFKYFKDSYDFINQLLSDFQKDPKKTICILFIVIVLFVFIFWICRTWFKKDKPGTYSTIEIGIDDNSKNLNVGNDSVVIGNVAGNIGNGSVVIGPTDNKGNVILNQPMAVGRNARAGHGSIAIGAHAGAGIELE